MILKLSKSKKAVLAVDDDGNVYITSVTFLNGMVNEGKGSGFILMKKMPNKVPSNKFKSSEEMGAVYDPMHTEPKREAKNKPVEDVNVW